MLENVTAYFTSKNYVFSTLEADIVTCMEESWINTI